MPQVSVSLDELFKGIAPRKVSVGLKPLVKDARDLLPTTQGLQAFSWLLAYTLSDVMTPGFMYKEEFYRANRGWARTPEGVYFAQGGRLYRIEDTEVVDLGRIIPCTKLVSYKGCLAVMNPYGKGGLLVYPPQKLPLAASRVGQIDMLGFEETGLADTLGCVWFGSSGMGLLKGFFLQGTYLTLCFESGIHVWNIIYDFNNILEGHEIIAAAGGSKGGFFITKNGVLWHIAETKLTMLGYDHLFRGRSLELSYHEMNELLCVRDTSDGTTWLFNQGMCSVGHKTLGAWDDAVSGDFQILDRSGHVWTQDTLGRAPFEGWLETYPTHLGVPGTKRFAFMATVCSQFVPMEITATVDDRTVSGEQLPEDNFFAIDNEGYQLSLRIAPVGLNSGEFMHTALLFYNPTDKRFLNDVVSNG